MAALALPVVQRADGSPALEQRCAALEGTLCRVYSRRPSVCRAFNCRVQVALGEGEVSAEEALAVVDEAKALIEALARELPEPRELHPLTRARRTAKEGGTFQEPARTAWQRAEAYLDRHFRARTGR